MQHLRSPSRLESLVRESIKNAMAGRSKLPPEILELSGYSSSRIRHLLNNLASSPDVNYLEVGTWKGSTLLSASYRNPGRFTGIDNFSQFRYRQLRSPRRVLERVRRRFAEECRTTFHDVDCWRVDLARLEAGVNVYFYDGEHSRESHRKAFTYFDGILAEDFVALVDDWNWQDVREGTRDALDELGYLRVLEYEFFTESNGSRADWWNGLYLGVLQKRAEPAARPDVAGLGGFHSSRSARIFSTRRGM